MSETDNQQNELSEKLTYSLSPSPTVLNPGIDYFNTKMISNSALKYLNPSESGSPRMFKEYFFPTLPKQSQSNAFALGSLIDKYFETPEVFINLDNVKKPDPSTKIGAFTQAYYDYLTSHEFMTQRAGKNEIQLEALAFRHARTIADYAPRYTDDAVRKQYDENGKSYVNFMLENKDKIVLTTREESVLKAVKNSISRDSILMSYLFTRESTENFEILIQPVIVSSYQTTAMLTGEQVYLRYKGKLDKVFIHHNTQTIELIDIKTTSDSVYNFNKSFHNYRYYRQLALYGILLQNLYPNYTINYKIAALGTIGLCECAVLDIDPTWINAGRAEIENLMSRAAFHIVNDSYNQPAEVIENGGTVNLIKPSYY